MPLPRFRLRSLLIAVAVFALYLALARVHVLLGIVVAVLTAPSLLWTAAVVRATQARGEPVSVPVSIGFFLVRTLYVAIGLVFLVLYVGPMVVIAFDEIRRSFVSP